MLLFRGKKGALMRRNKVKQALNEGKTVVGTMTTEFRNPEVARVLAAAGFDFLLIDNEHSAYSLETVNDMIRAAKPTGLVPIVRVPEAEYYLIARRLDIGAQGVMIPRVETRETVELVVRSVKYPPMGARGYGVRVIHTDHEKVSIKEAIEHFNEDTLVVIQIENKTAIDHIDELMSVEGVDVGLIGPSDLSISLGVPGEPNHPRMIEYIEKMVEGCIRNGVAPGIHIPDMDALRRWSAKGMRFLAYSNEIGLLRQAATAAVEQMRAMK